MDPGKGHRPAWDDGDCQVRALVVATGLHYPDAWELLYRLQRKHMTPGFQLVGCLKHDPQELGVIRQISCQPAKGQRRLTVRDFCAKYPKGNFIVQVAHHVVGVEDGRYYDRFDSGRMCVYIAWEVREAKAVAP
jgi:hypothetical protein